LSIFYYLNQHTKMIAWTVEFYRPGQAQSAAHGSLTRSVIGFWIFPNTGLNFKGMCGRYTAAKDFNELIKLVGVIMARAPFIAPRYNIAPTQLAPVIYMERHQPAMKLMRWGLIPSWAKDESVGSANINARSETLQSRNSFREAFKQRRCLIPADSFYEWQEREGKRQPFRVMLKSGEPFCFAGLLGTVDQAAVA